MGIATNRKSEIREGAMEMTNKQKIVSMGALLALGLAAVGLSIQADAAALNDVSVSQRGSQILVDFQFDGPVDQPASFSVNQPARIVLDFDGATSSLGYRSKDLGVSVLDSISVLDGGDRTRATLNLSNSTGYQVFNRGDRIVLEIEGGSAAAASAPVAEQPAKQRRSVPGVKAMVESVDFRRGDEGQGIVILNFTDPSVSVDVREEGSNIIAEVIGASLPRGQERRLDVLDFATPVQLVDAVNVRGEARITIKPSGNYEYLAYQSEGSFTIEVAPKIEEAEEVSLDVFGGNQEFTGELLSLNFQDIEIRAVLNIIADFTGLNVVVSDTVGGNITLRLQNVPWDQAMDIILRTKGLTARQVGNVIYIAPQEEVAAREKIELEARQAREDLAPLQSVILAVNYAKAEDLAKLLEATTSSSGSGENQQTQSQSLLSERGKVSVDERTNSILIQDVSEKVDQVRELVRQLDIPVRQVMIDSRVVIARDDYSKELGVRFGVSGVGGGNGGISSISGSSNANDTVISSAVGNILNSGQAYPVAVPSLADRLGVSLPVANPAGQVALALLGSDYLVDLELSALQAEGRGETLSNPRVLTTDRHEAVISQGTEIPYQTRDGDGAATTEFKAAVLELRVTPQITPDGNVIMDLEVSDDTRGENVGSGIAGGTIPTIDTRNLETQVLVGSGETVVLGGIYQKITRVDVDKVPFFGDLPAIGRLFRKDTNSNTQLELLIFVTPQIIKQSADAR